MYLATCGVGTYQISWDKQPSARTPNVGHKWHQQLNASDVVSGYKSFRAEELATTSTNLLSATNVWAQG